MSWGRWTLEAPGRASTQEYALKEHEHTQSTQVQGPRKEVRPLLLLLALIYVVSNRVREKLLELYASYRAIRQVSSSSVDRPWVVPRAGGPGAPYIVVPWVTV